MEALTFCIHICSSGVPKQQPCDHEGVEELKPLHSVFIFVAQVSPNNSLVIMRGWRNGSSNWFISPTLANQIEMV